MTSLTRTTRKRRVVKKLLRIEIAANAFHSAARCTRRDCMLAPALVKLETSTLALLELGSAEASQALLAGLSASAAGFNFAMSSSAVFSLAIARSYTACEARATHKQLESSAHSKLQREKHQFHLSLFLVGLVGVEQDFAMLLQIGHHFGVRMPPRVLFCETSNAQ